jgi:hypothetical protein
MNKRPKKRRCCNTWRGSSVPHAAACMGTVDDAGSISRLDPDVQPDWQGKCEVCGESPIMPVTGMCGPCTTGEADTAMGEW